MYKIYCHNKGLSVIHELIRLSVGNMQVICNNQANNQKN